jgi:hypothetical protein
VLNKKTIREIALENLVAVVDGISEHAPLGDPYGIEFSEIYREPPQSLSAGRRAVAIIQETAEQKTEQNYPVVNCELNVMIEINVMKAAVSMAVTLNDYMGGLERAIRANRTLNDTVYNLLILGSDVTPQGVYSNYGAGVLRLRLYYRHHADDPRKIVS